MTEKMTDREIVMRKQSEIVEAYRAGDKDKVERTILNPPTFQERKRMERKWRSNPYVKSKPDIR